MNDELFERVLVQLQPELAQEFGYAILEDRKKLKALEIIKEKEVNINYFKSACSTMSYEQYLSMWDVGCFVGIQMTSKTMLTQEEYDLLKEVLL